jgi:hypothetical protein
VYSWGLLISGAYPGFVGLEAYTILGVSFNKKFKITNTKLGTKVNNYLGALPGHWKGPVNVRGPEI